MRRFISIWLKSLVLAALLLPTASLAWTCQERFDYFEFSSYWWGAFGLCKQPSGTVDRDQIFACAVSHLPPADQQNACLIGKLKVSESTRLGIDAVVAYNTPLTCTQRFNNYETSSWWWGALGTCKQNPGGSTDRDAIFNCAFALVPAPESQDLCFRTKLRNSSITNQGIDVVVLFNTPPSCDQLFVKYDGSSFWQTALNNCDKQNGPTTSQGVLDCAWAQVPAHEQNPCLKNRLAITGQTLVGMLVAVMHNTSVARNSSTIDFNSCATPSTGCPETCDGLTDGGVPANYFSPSMPMALADSSFAPAPYFPSPGSSIGTQEGRLVPELRAAARLADPLGCSLRASAILFAQGKQDSRAQAFADLAVTGRRAFAAFKAIQPKEEFCAAIPTRTPGGCPNVGDAPDAQSLAAGCVKALDRAYRVANFLRSGETLRVDSPWFDASGNETAAMLLEKTRKQTERDLLGWIAVSGEDDQPHRPVNVPSSPSPQYELDVDVATPRGPASTQRVKARFVVAQSRAVAPAPLPTLKTRSRWKLQPELGLNIAPGSEVILFVHGMDSRAEESEDITRALFKRMSASSKNLVIISVDLPTSGYTQNLDFDLVSPLSDLGTQSWWFNPFLGAPMADFLMSGLTPQLDFLEAFVIAFAQTLDTTNPFLPGVKAVMGGSLGGNLAFRLGRSASAPWLPATVAWSPASIWNSLGEGVDPFQHAGPYVAFDRAKDRLAGDLNDFGAGRLAQRQSFFDGAFDRPITWGFIPGSQPQMWTADNYACKYSGIIGARLDRHETYDGNFRAWHWRLAAEQLLFSHQTVDPVTGQKRFKGNFKRMLLACGGEDNVPFNGICSATEATAPFMTTTPGKAIFLNWTGHSIANERPTFFAGQLDSFLQLF